MSWEEVEEIYARLAMVTEVGTLASVRGVLGEVLHEFKIPDGETDEERERLLSMTPPQGMDAIPGGGPRVGSSSTMRAVTGSMRPVAPSGSQRTVTGSMKPVSGTGQGNGASGSGTVH